MSGKKLKKKIKKLKNKCEKLNKKNKELNRCLNKVDHENSCLLAELEKYKNDVENLL